VIDSLDCCHHFLLVEGVWHHLSLVAKIQYTTPPWCHGEAGVRLQSPFSPTPQPPPLSSTIAPAGLPGMPFDYPSVSLYYTYWMQSPAFHSMQLTCYIFCNLHANCLRSSRRNARIHCSA